MRVLSSFINLNKWLKLSLGGALCAVVIYAIVSLNDKDSVVVRNLIIPLGLPGAFALMGLLEIITGVPFNDISGKWDNLKGWQRGVLGIIIAILSFIVAMFGIVLFA